MRKLDRFSRRRLLKGFLAGSLVTIGLPPLDMFLNSHGTAYAAEPGGFPKRFGIFFWGNGVLPHRFTPIGEGAEWQVSEELAALEPHKAKLSVVSGMEVKVPNLEPHWATLCGMLTGGPILMDGTDWTFSAPTIDQFLASEIGDATRFASIEVGTAVGSKTVCYAGPNSPISPEREPLALFERVFGGGFQLPGEAPIIDPTLTLQRSVLDAVMDDITAVKASVGYADRLRLDQHFDGIRSLEQRLRKLEEEPPNYASCDYPPMPEGEYPDIEGRPQIQVVNRAFCDILAYALACDQTRVFTNIFTRPLTNILFANATAGHHQLTHDEPGEQVMVHDIILQCMEAFAYQLQALDAIAEGDGTLLDHCLLLGTSDVGLGKTHTPEDFPIVLAGGASGAIKTGIHYSSPANESTTKVLLSIVRAMGVDAASFGAAEGEVSESLTAIDG